MPRAGLNPERVVDLGCEIADEMGWDGLTLAAVAQRAGVRLPSLYKHVANADDLRTRIAVRALSGLRESLAAAVEDAPGQELDALARAYRDFARAHPGRYPAVVRAARPDEPELAAAGGALLEVINAALAGYGLAGDDLVDAVRILRSALHGFVTLEAGGGFRMARDVEQTFTRMVAGLDAALGALSARA
ncbi:TetR/AcrR family transcriptional regulator [Georgenia yuyongxinii]|uniref:TetR/AcrR family transcriptional regulator n=1 Tax=Georgenia yuyongxinii TaxID=2589797 RepID=A0A5B8C7C1_9MICO|nr:TetR/AcrR family transcriptional regulator [Georgenia yuyongxinii]QDC26348.1 TetR/AcrR family transcriptional regulator [Georgenia yuyongxinii]